MAYFAPRLHCWYIWRKMLHNVENLCWASNAHSVLGTNFCGMKLIPEYYTVMKNLYSFVLFYDEEDFCVFSYACIA